MTKIDSPMFRCYNCKKDFGVLTHGGILLQECSTSAFILQITEYYTKINFCSEECVKAHKIKMIDRTWHDKFVDFLERRFKRNK